MNKQWQASLEGLVYGLSWLIDHPHKECIDDHLTALNRLRFGYCFTQDEINACLCVECTKKIDAETARIASEIVNSLN